MRYLTRRLCLDLSLQKCIKFCVLISTISSDIVNIKLSYNHQVQIQEVLSSLLIKTCLVEQQNKQIINKMEMVCRVGERNKEPTEAQCKEDKRTKGEDNTIGQQQQQRETTTPTPSPPPSPSTPPPLSPPRQQEVFSTQTNKRYSPSFILYSPTNLFPPTENMKRKELLKEKESYK